MLTITISTRAAVIAAASFFLALAAVPFAISRAEGGEPAAIESRAPVSTAFQYQGRLELDGVPANGIHVLGFTLYDDAVAGTEIGSPITANVQVTDGLFSVPLDFGENAFNGDARWLKVEALVGNSFVQMGSRQALRATPYAIHSLTTGPHDHTGESWLTDKPLGLGLSTVDEGAITLNLSAYGSQSSVIHATNYGNCGISGYVCYGVWGKATNFPGGSGFGGVGVRGDGSNAGVLGVGPQFGVYGDSAGVGVRGASSNSGVGVEGTSSGSSNAIGVKGSVSNGGGFGVGVRAEATGNDIALQASAVNGVAVQATSTNGDGVYAQGDDFGVYGQAITSSTGVGVFGYGRKYGVHGLLTVGPGYAGYFEGGGVHSVLGYTSGSDLRLKHDVRDLEQSLATVMALRPIRYQYNAAEGEHIGLIAQEVLGVLPELVAVDPTTEDGMLGLNYTELIPVLIKAMQEQQVRIEALEAALAGE